MSDPKRWSSSGSDVDPVLRSVMRYARDLAPTTSEAQALLRKLQDVEAGSRLSPRARQSRYVRRARALFMGAALTLVGAGVAWAGYAIHARRTASVSAVSHAAEPRRNAGPVRATSPTARAAAPEPASSSESAPPAPLPARSATARVTGSSADGTMLDGATLLQSARRVVVSSPNRALSLTREHALRFPQSPLSEERSALQIEALFRLGRVSESRDALTAFQRAYPRSPYRHRLQSLLTP